MRDAPRSPAAPRAWLAAIALLSIAVFAPSLRNGFTYDDEYVARSSYPDGRPNEMVSELHSLGDYFGARYWQGEHDTRPEYRPVSILSYALVYHVAGRALGPREALPQHALNVLLHALATALVYALLRRIGAGELGALCGTAVFAVHAIHSEVVASVVGRAELLAFVPGAAAVLAAPRQGGARGRSWARGAVAAALFFLAFGAKESALAWAPFLAVVRFARGVERDPGARLPPLALRALGASFGVAAIPLAAFLALRAAALADLPPDLPIASPESNPLAHVDTAPRILSAVAVQGLALAKTLAPFRLASDYGAAVLPVVASPLEPRFLVSLAALGALLAAGLAGLRREPLAFAAVAAFLGFGFLTSNVPMAIGTVFAERLLYAPSLGLSLAVAAAERQASGAALRNLLAAALAAWLVASAGVAFQRNAAWRSNEALYLTDVATQPRSARLHVLASDVWAARGDRVRQFEHLARAFALGPDAPRDWLKLAWFFQGQRRLAEAELAARRGLAAARQAPRYGVHLHWTLAEVLDATGRSAPAERQREAALVAWQGLRGRPDGGEAVAALREALAGQMPASRAWLGLAGRLERRGRPDEAALCRALASGAG